MTGRHKLPQMSGRNMTCGGGFETWLEHVDGIKLRHFCAFELLDQAHGRSCLSDYHRKLVEAAVANGFGVINEGLHYRASRDWGELLGYSREALEEINIRGIEFYRDFAREYDSPETPMIVGGVVGPRGDAYAIRTSLSAAEAEDYHSEQIRAFRRAGIDLVTAMTLSSVEEAIGIARAATAEQLPVVISFMLRIGGRLPGGETLAEAISSIDTATNKAPAYYMVNCTHPAEFEPALATTDWTRRFGGFLPNAVAMDAHSLCGAGHLLDGDPVQLGEQVGDLARRLPHVYVWGGCCGTDARHIGEITRRVSEVRL